MKESDNDLSIDNKNDSFGTLSDLSNKNINKNTVNNNKNENDIKLTSTIIKSEEKRRKKSDFSENYIENNENQISNNITILIFIIFIISLGFVFKNKLISFKKRFLSNSLSFTFNIFYSNPKYTFLLFIILICCKTFSTGLKLLLLQLIAYILCFITLLIKKKINNSYNTFQKDKVTFYCVDIIISFLYLGEKLLQITEENSFSKMIKIIVLIFNINIIIYFVLVEIINCQYDEVIIDILYALIISIIVFYSIFYIMKIKIKPKKIISIILSNIILSSIISLSFLFSFFYLCLMTNKLEYFFVRKIIMKFIGFLIYIIYELYYFFRNYEDKKIKYFYLFNIYSNRYLYSNTNNIKTLLRVFISVIIEYFLMSRMDISYKNNFNVFQCYCIILLDIIHGFLALFIVKYIFNLMNLNNKILLNIDFKKPFIRYGSFTESKDNEENEPLFFIE